MLTKTEIVEYIRKSPKLKGVCRKLVPYDLVDDLIQELVVSVLEYPDEKLAIVKSLDGFLCKMLFNMTNKTHGTFGRKYLQNNSVEYKEQEPDFDEYNYKIDLDYQKCIRLMGRIEGESDDGWYMANLFRIYMREGSIRKVNKVTGIPVMSIQVSLTKFKDIIKSRI